MIINHWFKTQLIYYTVVGTYNVIFRATNSAGTTTLTKQVTISAIPSSGGGGGGGSSYSPPSSSNNPEHNLNLFGI